MVNKGLRAYLIELAGESGWQRIRAQAGVELDQFVSMQAYPDEVTYGLATSAASLLQRPLGELLTGFGRFWIGHVQREGYGELLAFLGTSLPQCLASLDDMHTRLSLSFPEYHPPSFELQELEPGAYLLHYHSERPGLAPFVVGLVRGLAETLGQPARIELRGSREQGATHDTLEVQLLSPGATR